MKRPKPHAPRIALDLLAWRSLDYTAPGAMAFAVPGFHASMPFDEPLEYPSAPQHTHAAGLPDWSPSRPQPVEYRVGLRFTNISTTPFRFDKIVAEVFPSAGFGGTFRTTIQDGGTGPAKTRVIRPGETLDHVAHTNGYTGDLLRDSGGQPLRLGLAMLLRDRIAGGPWHAQLPLLPDLPRFDRDHFSPEEEIPQGAWRLHVPSLADN